ncbi:MAG: hypothetical protein OEY89_12630, partial [Gammaproteobacteria bacterium]|nr:hypothetical protein [Gammaproteobacteria bacterium]
TIDMASQQQGIVNFKWDGLKKVVTEDGVKATDERFEAGNYTIKAEMLAENKMQAVSSMVVDSVESVSLGVNGQGMTLNLAQGGGTTMSQVKQIF